MMRIQTQMINNFPYKRTHALVESCLEDCRKRRTMTLPQPQPALLHLTPPSRYHHFCITISSGAAALANPGVTYRNAVLLHRTYVLVVVCTAPPLCAIIWLGGACCACTPVWPHPALLQRLREHFPDVSRVLCHHLQDQPSTFACDK